MSILRYLKQLANELPHPAEVPSVPASTIIAVNHAVETTLSRKGVARATIAIARNKLDKGRHAVVYGTSSAVRKCSKAYASI